MLLDVHSEFLKVILSSSDCGGSEEFPAGKFAEIIKTKR